MTMRSARSWLGLYFLVSTAMIGVFLLLFRGTTYLPLEEDQATAAFQVIVPVFVGELAIIFQWMTRLDEPSDPNEMCPVPAWAIVLPPIVAIGIFVSSVFALAASNAEDATFQVSPNTFQSAVTFAVTILNTSTVLLVSRIFPNPRARRRRTS